MVAMRPIIRHHSSTMVTMANRGVYTANPETGYRKDTVSENKRMTDISGDPDRAFAVALSTNCCAFRSIKTSTTTNRWNDLKAKSRAIIRACISQIALDNVG